jgi:hypothetical protein
MHHRDFSSVNLYVNFFFLRLSEFLLLILNQALLWVLLISISIFSKFKKDFYHTHFFEIFIFLYLICLEIKHFEYKFFNLYSSFFWITVLLFSYFKLFLENSYSIFVLSLIHPSIYPYLLALAHIPNVLLFEDIPWLKRYDFFLMIQLRFLYLIFVILFINFQVLYFDSIVKPCLYPFEYNFFWILNH